MTCGCYLVSPRQHPMYNGGELRWQQPNPSPSGPYLAYPILSSPQPPVSNDYAYYQIMPAPCPPVMGFYQPFPGAYAGPVQAGRGVVPEAATPLYNGSIFFYHIAYHRERKKFRMNFSQGVRKSSLLLSLVPPDVITK